MFGRKNNGVLTIDRIIGQFKDMVSGLSEGINGCDTQKKENETTISLLENENRFLSEKTTQATNFRNNLQEMLTSPKPLLNEKQKDKPKSK